MNPAAQHGKSEFCWKDKVSKLHALAQRIISSNLEFVSSETVAELWTKRYREWYFSLENRLARGGR